MSKRIPISIKIIIPLIRPSMIDFILCLLTTLICPICENNSYLLLKCWFHLASISFLLATNQRMIVFRSLSGIWLLLCSSLTIPFIHILVALAWGVPSHTWTWIGSPFSLTQKKMMYFPNRQTLGNSSASFSSQFPYNKGISAGVI